MKRLVVLAALAAVTVGWGGAQAAMGDTRLTNDCADTPGTCGAPPGYFSAYTIATGIPYTDDVLNECSVAHGRQNEPAIEADPRNPSVLIGSSNDYCGVYLRDESGTPAAVGPVWLGYYRSQDGGSSFISSLVPGYPGDTSPFASLAHVRTAGSGDPAIAWDAQGRVFLAAESSDDPAGSKKGFGDEWVARYVNPDGPTGDTASDGKLYQGTEVVARGSSAPFPHGKFNDKTAIQADHNSDGTCDNVVYFSWSRFTGNSGGRIYFSRSTDHGVTWSNGVRLSGNIHDSQYPEISVTGSSNVYLTWKQYAAQGNQPTAIVYVRSTDCGRTFSAPRILTTFTDYFAQDVADPQAEPIPQATLDDPAAGDRKAKSSSVGECGDFDEHCASGYTFFRRDSQVRSTGDQFAGPNNETLYVVYDPTIPGTETPTGTTYGSIEPGTGSQSGVYFLRFEGSTGAITSGPTLVDPTDYASSQGMQLFPDIAADGGQLHAVWWDSRNDECYSAARPVGNCADRTTVPALDAFASTSTDGGAVWSAGTRLSSVTSNPNYEQFANRIVPFAGDYLWITGIGSTAYGTWTDWRNTVQGTDPRETPEDEEAATADVHQCRAIQQIPGKKGATTNEWSSDQCPEAGGLDQDIYGNQAP